MYRLVRLAKSGSFRRHFASSPGVLSIAERPSWPPGIPTRTDPEFFSTDHALRFYNPVSAFHLEKYKPIYAKRHQLQHISLPKPFSCDWRYWFHGLDLPDLIQTHMSRDFGIQGPIEPMVFAVGETDPVFAYKAGGEYYLYDGVNVYLERYVTRFVDDEDFLRRCHLAERVYVPGQYAQEE